MDYFNMSLEELNAWINDGIESDRPRGLMFFRIGLKYPAKGAFGDDLPAFVAKSYTTAKGFIHAEGFWVNKQNFPVCSPRRPWVTVSIPFMNVSNIRNPSLPWEDTAANNLSDDQTKANL